MEKGGKRRRKEGRKGREKEEESPAVGHRYGDWLFWRACDLFFFERTVDDLAVEVS